MMNMVAKGIYILSKNLYDSTNQAVPPFAKMPNMEHTLFT